MLAIAGGKGGSGKTTTALGLGRALARQGREPIVVDCDCDMPDIHHRIGTDREIGVDELAAGEPIESVCRSVPAVPGVRLITAGKREHVGSALIRLDGWHGPVLLDCPPGLSGDSIGPLRHADTALVVTTDQPQSVEDTRRTARSIRTLDTPIAGVLIRETEDSYESEWSPDTDVLARVETVADPLDNPAVRTVWRRVIRRIGGVFDSNGDGYKRMTESEGSGIFNGW